MGISKKNKRKITFNGKVFYWWIKNEFTWDSGMLSINIASENKKFLIKYIVVREDEGFYIEVIGSEFPGIETKKGNNMKFICPKLIDYNPRLGPKDAISILKWCFDEDKVLILKE